MKRTPARMSRDLRRATNLLVPVIRAVERREWKPTPVAAILLRELRAILTHQPRDETHR